MKNNKKLFLFGVIFVILVIFFITIFYIVLTNLNDNVEKIKIYYYDKLSHTLFSEEKKLIVKDNVVINNIFEEMKITPRASNLKSIISKDLNLLGYTLDKDTLEVNISKEYNNLSNVEQIIFRVGFVWTMTELENINNIKFLVENVEIKYDNGKTIGYLNRENTILNPLISPDKIDFEKVTLYFANDNKKLVEETRRIEVKQNKSMELHIVEELINGPKSKKYFKTIPQETKIRNIKTEGNICYVDLSSDFIIKLSGNPSQQNLAIYSIVNSLTNLKNVNKVQFLIEGEKTNLSKESVDISQPLDRYEQIIENDKQ